MKTSNVLSVYHSADCNRLRNTQHTQTGNTWQATTIMCALSHHRIVRDTATMCVPQQHVHPAHAHMKTDSRHIMRDMTHPHVGHESVVCETFLLSALSLLFFWPSCGRRNSKKWKKHWKNSKNLPGLDVTMWRAAARG